MTQIQTKQKEAKRIFLKKLGIETDLEGRVKIDQTTMKKLKPIPHRLFLQICTTCLKG